MAILAFQRPEKVIMIKSDDKQGLFEFRPLEPGYGITVGNALRRILLSSLEGFAITSVKIEGVTHEFTTIKGVLEDVTNIVLNLKQVRFKQQLDDVDSEKVKITISSQNVFKAGDINKFLNGFQVLNPELEICHMENNVRLILELTINKGRGYVPSEENKVEGAHVDTIAIDSIHTPIKNVQYQVENFRVEQKTDYEKLVLNIDTDGSISPENALKEAAKILIQHFMLFSDDRMTIETEEKPVTEVFDESDLHMRQLLKTRLADMDLSVRALNCLKAAEVETMGELVSFNKNDLLKFRNFGKKSLTELEDLVKSKGLEFGMNVAKYKIDKD
ncbi:MAG: DNA-directed RNA polymerase subunit alpha [Bacteroidales bacterium]|jgi:DNA-directed RNA polymerase subunit alpha|nr:DNA-directed RNA polymerase subunit alpha [Bacteroidales bacterium]